MERIDFLMVGYSLKPNGSIADCYFVSTHRLGLDTESDLNLKLEGEMM